jgi:hypothetical protein
MKTKLTLLFFFAFVVKEMSAFTIRMRPGPTSGYYYIHMDEDRMNCRCVGNQVCPYNVIALDGSTGKSYDGTEVVDAVMSAIRSGQSSGEMQLNGDLTVSWKLKDEELTISTNEKMVHFSIPLDELQKKYNTGEVCDK